MRGQSRRANPAKNRNPHRWRDLSALHLLCASQARWPQAMHANVLVSRLTCTLGVAALFRLLSSFQRKSGRHSQSGRLHGRLTIIVVINRDNVACFHPEVPLLLLFVLGRPERDVGVPNVKAVVKTPVDHGGTGECAPAGPGVGGFHIPSASRRILAAALGQLGGQLVQVANHANVALHVALYRAVHPQE